LKLTTLEMRRLQGDLREVFQMFKGFDHLDLPSNDEIRKLILSISAKSSPMDKIPTTVIKSRVDVLLLRSAVIVFN